MEIQLGRRDKEICEENMAVDIQSAPAEKPVPGAPDCQQGSKGPQKDQIPPLPGEIPDSPQQHQIPCKPGEDTDGADVEIHIQQEIAPGGTGKAVVQGFPVSHGDCLLPPASRSIPQSGDC